MALENPGSAEIGNEPSERPRGTECSRRSTAEARRAEESPWPERCVPAALDGDEREGPKSSESSCAALEKS